MSQSSPYSKNTPDYLAKKKGIVYFYTMSGVNAILAAIMSHWFAVEPNSNLFLLGVMFIGFVPFVWIDKRKDNNSVSALIGSAVVHFGVTLICAVNTNWGFVLIVYLCELCLFLFLGKMLWLR